MKWTYPIVAFIVVFVLGFGLTNLIKEDLEVSPWSESGAEEGRLCDGDDRQVAPGLPEGRVSAGWPGLRLLVWPAVFE